MTLVSVVVTLDRIWSFHASRVPCTTVSSAVPAGICESTFWHACSAEMNDTPTLDVRLAVSKVYSTPSRADEVTLSPAGYAANVAFVLPVPRNVAYDDGAASKDPQK